MAKKPGYNTFDGSILALNMPAQNQRENRGCGLRALNLSGHSRGLAMIILP